MRLSPFFIALLICAGGLSVADAQSQPDESIAKRSVADNSAIAIINQRPLSARILGGGNAEPGEYPSMVALVSPGFIPLSSRLFCGGTVVAERWVLTAAHCVHDAFKQPLEPAFLRAVVGITDLELETPDREHLVSQIIVHPDYDSSLDLPPNDVALIEFETALAAPIVTLFTGDTDEYTGELGFIAGWGAIEYSDPISAIYPTMLQDAAVPLISNELCNAPESYDGLIVNSHLCAGFADGEIDACAGDSGGPLFINTNGVQVQAGITSFGIGCGLPLFYGIYTNVSHFIPWIGQYVDVPYQSPELVASRAAQANQRQDNDSDERSFLGGSVGINELLLLLLAMSYRSYAVQKPHLKLPHVK